MVYLQTIISNCIYLNMKYEHVIRFVYPVQLRLGGWSYEVGFFL